MRLAVVGATGGAGVRLVEQARRRGHDVVALSRSEEKAERLLPEDVDVVLGDATDRASLRGLVEDADAVLDVSGPTRGGPDDYRARSTGALVSAMRDGGVERLIHLTGAGVRAEGDDPGVADRVFRGAMRLVAGQVLRDSTAAVDLLRGADDLRWTVVRAPRLTDREPTGTARVVRRVGPESGTQVTRSDLAAALLDLVENDERIGDLPVVTR